MTQEKMTLRQFQRRFQDEKACLDYLFKLRWPRGYRCPRCGHSRHSFHSTRRLYQCSKCKYQVSVTAGTIFHKTRTPLVHWFWIIFLMTRQKSGVSMLSLQSMLGLKTYRTVWTMSHKIRKAMADRDAHYQPGGLVETLQAYLKTNKTGRAQHESESRPSIIVTVENRGDSPGFARMRHVPAMEEESTGKTIRERTPSSGKTENAASKAAKALDIQEAYDELNPLLIAERKPARTRWGRVLMANLTGNIRGVHHGVSEKHLHRYLAEFLYRFNRRVWNSQLLDRALTACVSGSTITYAELKM